MILTSHWDVQFNSLVGSVPYGAVAAVLRRRLVHHWLQDTPSGVDKPGRFGLSGFLITVDSSS